MADGGLSPIGAVERRLQSPIASCEEQHRRDQFESVADGGDEMQFAGGIDGDAASDAQVLLALPAPGPNTNHQWAISPKPQPSRTHSTQ